MVSAFDVRSAVKEQVESLGAKFVQVDAEESGDGAGGYAKEMSEAYKTAQREKLMAVIKTQDIVITTAQIPFKKAPILITKKMVQSMKPGGIVFDLAAESGGNCEVSVCDNTVDESGVKIMAPSRPLSTIPCDASQMFAKNLWSLLQLILIDPQNISLEDEIVKAALLTHNGQIHFQVH